MEEPIKTATVPFEPTCNDAWTVKAQQMLTDGKLTHQVSTSGRFVDAHVQGPCPRCGHRFDGFGYFAKSTISKRTRRNRPVPAPRWIKVNVECRCNRKHPGWPIHSDGCGVSFSVKVPSGLEPTPIRHWWSRFTRR